MPLQENQNIKTDDYIQIISNKLAENSISNENKIVMETILKKLNDIKEIEFHRSIADRQKNAYNRMIKDIDLLTNNIIIEVANNI
jgi:hypothetical protein